MSDGTVGLPRGADVFGSRAHRARGRDETTTTRRRFSERHALLGVQWTVRRWSLRRCAAAISTQSVRLHGARTHTAALTAYTASSYVLSFPSGEKTLLFTKRNGHRTESVFRVTRPNACTERLYARRVPGRPSHRSPTGRRFSKTRVDFSRAQPVTTTARFTTARHPDEDERLEPAAGKWLSTGLPC